MSGFPIIDLVVGMIFIFFLLSIICSSAVELLFSLLRTRAVMLEQWLKQIFDKPSLDSDGTPGGVSVGQAIMDHCMARALSDTGKSPTYINAMNFVSALLDKITLVPAAGPAPQVQLPPRDLKEYIDAIQKSDLVSGELKRTILAIAYEAEKATALGGQVKSELDHFRERLELWYNKNAERLTGKFKSSKVLPMTFVVATVITLLLNADTVSVGRYLYDHKEASKQISDQAMSAIGNYGERIKEMTNPADTARPADSLALERLNENAAQLRQDISRLTDSLAGNLPLGWKGEKTILEKGGKEVDWPRTIFSKIGTHGIGWLATILATCLGAPFWFDILNKIANLRGSGSRPSTEKGEK